MTRKLTRQQKADKILKVGGGDILHPDSPDGGTKTYHWFICHLCGDTYERIYNSFVNSEVRCNCVEAERRSQPKNKTGIKYPNNVEWYVANIEKKGYKVLKVIEFKKTNSRFLVQCDKGHEPYETEYCNFFRRDKEGNDDGRRCPGCKNEYLSKKYRLELEKAQEIARKAGLILLTEDFKNKKEVVDFACIAKSHKFKTTLDSIDSKHTGCPVCGESFMERSTRTLLEEFMEKKFIISFDSQKKYEDCRNVRPLPFDFIVEAYGKTILIELDGIQHFDSTVTFGGETSNFDVIRRCDIIKTMYCINKKIVLIRLSYKEENNIRYYLIKTIRRIRDVDRKKIYYSSELYEDLMDDCSDQIITGDDENLTSEQIDIKKSKFENNKFQRIPEDV